jgi:NAD+ synthase (glutamine-hydrolysing)
MDNYGFYLTAAAIPQVKVADVDYNCMQIKKLILEASEKGIQAVCFPELSVTAYTCGDLFFQSALVESAEKATGKLLEETANTDIIFIIGAPVVKNSKLYNCAIVCHYGKILGIIPKVNIPNYQEFYEKRWFEPYNPATPLTSIVYAGHHTPFGSNLTFNFHTLRFAVEICEDLWSVIPPSSYHAKEGAQIIFNLSASNELTGKRQYVQSLIAQQSARCIAGYIYASAGFGESSTDLVYSGNAYIYENGRLLSQSERFSTENQLIISEIDIELLESERKKNTTFNCTAENESYHKVHITQKRQTIPTSLCRTINPTPFIPDTDNYIDTCRDILYIQISGLAKRIIHTQAKTLILGISGGLDSTLALLVCINTVDKLSMPRNTILGVTMPGFGTTDRTLGNARNLMKTTGISTKEINIEPACMQHFRDIGHNPENHNTTYENTQSRERTQILMDLANLTGGIVIGTADMSEIALGWTTYSGDHISMYSINSGVPKTLVRHLIKSISETKTETALKETLSDILATPVSPELLPADAAGQITQKTEDIIGPYELHDFFLYHMLRYGFSPAKIHFLALQAFRRKYDDATIRKHIKTFYNRFFSQQFKRSCMPDGPKVGSVNLSPRGDWRMPSDASISMWLKEI